MPVINPITLKFTVLLLGSMVALAPITLTTESSDKSVRNPDIIYRDILPKDIGLYVNLEDEEAHKLESSIGINGEQRFNIKVWIKR